MSVILAKFRSKPRITVGLDPYSRNKRITAGKASVYKATSDDPINDVADRMQGKIQQAFLDAVASIQDKVALDKLADAIQQGDMNQALAILAIEKSFTDALQGVGVEAGLLTVKNALQATYAAGAQAALENLPAKAALNVSFDLMNQQSVDFIQNYTFDLIRGLSQTAQDTVQQSLLRAFKDQDTTPVDVARTIRSVIGLTPTQEQAIANYRKALEDGGATNLRNALDRALRDGRFDSTVQRALDNQTDLPAAKIDQMVDRYATRYQAYRAETVARSESVRASNAGQTQLWRQAIQQGYLKHDVQRRWVAQDDCCDDCDELDDETTGIDEPFSSGDLGPPLHPSCRCSTVLDFNAEPGDSDDSDEEEDDE